MSVNLVLFSEVRLPQSYSHKRFLTSLKLNKTKVITDDDKGVDTNQKVITIIRNFLTTKL